ncbi:sensor domain-containing diguanylate cyclase [Terriglobus aquaticus]|uniref:Sensor domain-containing diguanylate cyclase n=1 Tax=Terriglobus aquaticus TaxID=940139 RepID=A0ABW9KF78_9BACT|nr:sensor domain-containing diguanylate cyclase [Terriglobus aquaticus]
MDAKLQDEPGRIAALRRYEVLDTPREAPFERITKLVRAVLNVPISTISLIAEERQWFKSCVGMPGGETTRDESICTHTIQSREPLLVPDTLQDERFRDLPAVQGKPFLRSYAGVPLRTPDGYNIGSLCALDTQPRSFEPSQIEVLKNFAGLVVEELELRRIAQVDSLTEAVTRRGFLLEIEKAISTFRRSGRSAALIVLDVDHFKQVNDTHGHGVGDCVLREVCAALMPMLRREDVMGRLGGEEFGVLLNTTNLDEGQATAERLRAAVEKLRFSATVPFQVTASFGVACLEPGCDEPEVWLARADEALYAAKRGGRNRTCVMQSRPQAVLA